MATITGMPRARALLVACFWMRRTRSRGKLQAQVTAGHHHGIADAQNVVELFNCLRTLEFGNQRNVRRAGLAEGLARSLRISGALRMTVR